MTEQQKARHDWEFVRFESKEYVYVEECARCGARRRVAYMHGMIVEEEPEGLTRYCEDTNKQFI